MRLIPALSVKNRRVVILNNGDYEPVEDEDGRPLPPWQLARELFKHWDCLYVVDIDGLASLDPQFDVIRDISDHGELWADTGIASAEMFMDAIIAGASRAVVSTKRMYSEDLLGEVLEVSEEVIFEVAYRDGVVCLRAPLHPGTRWSWRVQRSPRVWIQYPSSCWAARWVWGTGIS